uniref:Secreted peptide prohormone 1 n=1 Tax=Schmidtea mediterranea TaxID=79327 RepID=E3T7T8_SCHMD|nr:secreted peptide prohormone 1 [Schmidtea mediterranea]
MILLTSGCLFMNTFAEDLGSLNADIDLDDSRLDKKAYWASRMGKRAYWASRMGKKAYWASRMGK